MGSRQNQIMQSMLLYVDRGQDTRPNFGFSVTKGPFVKTELVNLLADCEKAPWHQDVH